MAQFITQCPHCNTCFRTSITQLQSAEGKVRCGACLKIFVADDNLIPSSELRTVSLPPEREDERQSQPDHPEPLHAPWSDDDDSESDLTETIFTLDLADSLPNRRDPSISEHEPFWELFDDLPPEEAELAERDIEFGMTRSDAPEPASQSTSDDEDTPPDFPDESLTPGFGAAEFHAQQLHDDPALQFRTDFTSENLAAARELSVPLELHWQPEARRGGRLVLMSMLALLLLAGLLAQFVWYNRNELSQNQYARPWLERICAVAGCTLPSRIDVQSITSENLLVRSHTEIANALSVNLVFRNDAPFAQPFPLLNLRFIDANNLVVAARQFSPAEYLPSEISSVDMMPPGAPVQITLNIIDPGIAAVGYEVSFSPNILESQR